MTKQKVLFLCTGNSCRSQMAEGLLRSLAGDRFDAASAGTHPAGLNRTAVAAMKEIGIDISHHRSKDASEFDGQRFDAVITVCDRAKEACPLFPGAKVMLHWGLEDPAEAPGSDEERLAVFRRVRGEVSDRIREFVAGQTRRD
jgi:arsenate reductase